MNERIVVCQKLVKELQNIWQCSQKVRVGLGRPVAHGNRKTRETGWNFKALVVLNCGKVVYKLWSGGPGLERCETKKKPLGPLQERDSTVHVPSPY